MADIATDALDEGTDSPRAGRPQILAGVQRINDLANATLASKGAGLIGFGDSVAYSVGTVGAALQSNFGDLDALQEFAYDLAAGTPGIADVFGDSTMFGADPANLSTQVAIPPPAQLQNFVNTFFGTTALTVSNKAQSGSTASQMIAGTDGSGQTFAVRIAASGARVVFCNHGINDAFGASATTPAAYRAALKTFVKLTRAVTKTPVLVTPHPCLSMLTYGSQARAEATGRFAQIMREVAQKMNVVLIDNHRYFSMLLGQDGIRPETVFPDGVHATQPYYIYAGNNLAAAILGAQVPVITKAGQRVTATSAVVRATGQTISASTTAREGVVTTTGTTTPQTLRMLFRVEETGLDISLLHPIWNNGAGTISVNLDGTSIGAYGLPMLDSGFSSTFFQDWETQFVRNILPGFHILILTTGSTGAVGVHSLLSRATEKPLLLPSSGSTPVSQRKLISTKLELASTAANSLFVIADAPASRFIQDFEFEFDAKLLKTGTGSGVIIGGNVGSNSGSASAERAITIGLNASGFPFVQEANGPGSYATAAVFSSATDLSAASHTYRIKITAASPGTVTLYVDGAQVGTPINLARNFYGGYLGLWKSDTAGVLTITNLARVWYQ